MTCVSRGKALFVLGCAYCWMTVYMSIVDLVRKAVDGRGYVETSVRVIGGSVYLRLPPDVKKALAGRSTATAYVKKLAETDRGVVFLVVLEKPREEHARSPLLRVLNLRESSRQEQSRQ